MSSLPKIKTTSKIMGKYKLTIIEAKNKNSPWVNSRIKNAVMQCRATYLKYGNVPLEDDYDKKSIVYLIKVYFWKKKFKYSLSEIFTIRFVQAHGHTPYATEDFFHLNKNTDYKFFEKYLNKQFPEHKNILKHTATISKFCGLAVDTPYPRKLKATKEVFCLANKLFLENAQETQNLKYFTALFRQEVVNKSLIHKTQNRNILPNFTTAARTIGWQKKINRTFSAYHYPGYFLNLSTLQKTLKNLHQKKILPIQTLEFYLKKPITKKVLLDKPITVLEGKVFSQMLTASGHLRFSKISGNQLRKILDSKVKDGPIFYFFHRQQWQNSINNLFMELTNNHAA